MRFEDNSMGRRHLQELNSIPYNEEYQIMTRSIPMWNIEIMEDRKELPIYHTSYVGYIAMDQIIRDLDVPEKSSPTREVWKLLGPSDG
jgi:hypothetical protein